MLRPSAKWKVAADAVVLLKPQRSLPQHHLNGAADRRRRVGLAVEVVREADVADDVAGEAVEERQGIDGDGGALRVREEVGLLEGVAVEGGDEGGEGVEGEGVGGEGAMGAPQSPIRRDEAFAEHDLHGRVVFALWHDLVRRRQDLLHRRRRADGHDVEARELQAENVAVFLMPCVQCSEDLKLRVGRNQVDGVAAEKMGRWSRKDLSIAVLQTSRRHDDEFECKEDEGGNSGDEQGDEHVRQLESSADRISN